MEDTPREKLSDLTKLPNLQEMKFIAFIKVDGSSGELKPHDNNSNHLSFWMYAGYKAENSVLKVAPL